MRGVRTDLTGQIFERFRVVRFWKLDRWRNSMWLCRCDCGNTRVVVGRDLRNGHTKSCGCLNIEKSIARARKQTGENNPRYKLGEQQGWHTKEQKEFHESIRKRDNYTCQDCGKKQEQELADANKKLICHHINGDHFDNRDDNAVTLCGTCHNPYTEKQTREKEEKEWLDAAYSVQYPE